MKHEIASRFSSMPTHRVSSGEVHHVRLGDRIVLRGEIHGYLLLLDDRIVNSTV